MFNTGDTINNYTIIEPIGQGGMAIVYKAKTRDGQTVALKVMADNLALDQDFQSRFLREAQIMRKLNHRGVVRVIDHGKIDDRPYLAMEYMPLGSLDQYFKQGVRLSIGQSLQLLYQIADALDYAHSQIEDLHKQPVIHRDLKIDNILIDHNHRVAITDFGLARMQDDTRLSVSGVMMGTLMYISPEQIRSFKDVDYRTDLYALGIIAYVFLTGHFPFVGATYEEYIIKHLNEAPPLATELNSSLPIMLNSVLFRAIAKDPDDRYPSAKAFVDAVEATVRPMVDTYVEICTDLGDTTGQAPVNFSRILAQNTPVKSRRLPRKMVILLVLIAIVISVAALLVISQSGSSRTLVPRHIPTVSFNQGS